MFIMMDYTINEKNSNQILSFNFLFEKKELTQNNA